MEKDAKIFEFIRSTTHTIKFANKNKLNVYDEFLTEYRRISQVLIDLIWDGHVLPYSKFDCKINLDIPSYLKTANLNIETTLSARALDSCMTQVCGIIKSVCEKPRKRQYIVNKYRANNKKVPKGLRKNIRKSKPLTKPKADNINPELSSKCCELTKSNNSSFDYWLSLYSILNNKPHGFSIEIPIKFTKQSNKWNKEGELLGGFLLTNKNINIRWNIKTPVKTEGLIGGADQGKTDVLVIGVKENPQHTLKTDKHGHSLDSILEKMSKKKYGSKSFKKCQNHRKNFINWNINQLNLTDYKQINTETIFNINYGKNVSRGMKHWCNTLIRDKFSRFLEEHGVHEREDPSTYYSQRCHECEIVRKSQRVKKVYTCKNCGYIGDSDENSMANHQLDLPDASVLRGLGYNIKGFYWRSTGFYDLNGVELEVPLSKKLSNNRNNVIVV